MGMLMLQGNEYHSTVAWCPQMMFVLMVMMMLKMM